MISFLEYAQQNPLVYIVIGLMVSVLISGCIIGVIGLFCVLGKK